jgi:hypothetical protein
MGWREEEEEEGRDLSYLSKAFFTGFSSIS